MLLNLLAHEYGIPKTGGGNVKSSHHCERNKHNTMFSKYILGYVPSPFMLSPLQLKPPKSLKKKDEGEESLIHQRLLCNPNVIT